MGWGKLFPSLFLAISLVTFPVNAAETWIRVGPAQTANNIDPTGAILSITERFNDRYEITGGYITEQKFSFCDRPDCYWKVRQQLFIGGELLFPTKDKVWMFGMGPYYFQNSTRVVTSNFRWSLHVRWKPKWLPERMAFSIRHWSSGGSSEYGCFRRQYDNPDAGEFCGDWNTGLDSFFGIDYRLR